MKRNIHLTFFAILVSLSLALAATVLAQDPNDGACDNSTSGCYAVQDWTPFGKTLGGAASWVSLVNLFNCENQTTYLCTPLFNDPDSYGTTTGIGDCQNITITTRQFDGTVIDCLSNTTTAYPGCIVFDPASCDNPPGSGTYIVTIECIETGQIGVAIVTYNAEEITCAQQNT